MVVVCMLAKALIAIYSLILWPVFSSNITNDFKYVYHDHSSSIEILRTINEKCLNISRIYNLTETSVQGRELIVIELTENPGQHVLGKPEFKYIGNMHGNEPIGKEMLLRLVVYLCDAYLSGDELVTYLLSHTRVHIMPTMNPDGWQKAYNEFEETGRVGWLKGRNNANGVDLNRNFPDLNVKLYASEQSSTGRNNHLDRLQMTLDFHWDRLQPETRAVISWMAEYDYFVLSANFHEGDLVANYPFDETRSGLRRHYAKSPDDKTFIHLAKSYSHAHSKMSDPYRKPCDGDPSDLFLDGITNGGAWYSVGRGMQDYNYLETNCFEITLELCCEKFPAESKLQQLWEDNRLAMINFILQSHIGIKGMVTDAESGNPIAAAEVKVADLQASSRTINHDILSLSGGDYYRLLTDGVYRVTAQANGFHPSSRCVMVSNVMSLTSGVVAEAQIVNLHLSPVTKSTLAPVVDVESEAFCKKLSIFANRLAPSGLVGNGHQPTYTTDLTPLKEQKLLAEIFGSLHNSVSWHQAQEDLSLHQLYDSLAGDLDHLDQSHRLDVIRILPSQIKDRLQRFYNDKNVG